MTRAVSFYRLEDGMFTGLVTAGPDEAIEANTPPGCEAMDGVYDHLSQRVDLESGEVVDYTPPAPADDELRTWSWDAERRRWIATPTTAAHWADVRAERNRRLLDCDWTDTASAPARLGAETYAAWQTYRQALRDVTTQADPLAIEWPTAPSN